MRLSIVRISAIYKADSSQQNRGQKLPNNSAEFAANQYHLRHRPGIAAGIADWQNSESSTSDNLHNVVGHVGDADGRGWDTKPLFVQNAALLTVRKISEHRALVGKPSNAEPLVKRSVERSLWNDSSSVTAYDVRYADGTPMLTQITCPTPILQ